MVVTNSEECKDLIKKVINFIYADGNKNAYPFIGKVNLSDLYNLQVAESYQFEPDEIDLWEIIRTTSERSGPNVLKNTNKVIEENGYESITMVTGHTCYETNGLLYGVIADENNIAICVTVQYVDSPERYYIMVSPDFKA